MQSCCEPYSKKFDSKVAESELEDYRKGIIKKNSQPLIKALIKLIPSGAEVLDIGGGIGVIDFELFKSGLRKAVHIDLSEAYVRAFREEAARQSRNEKIISLHGDFLDLHHQIEAVDLVCLDKVICCYHHYQELVTLSVQKAKHWYAYVIPRDVWWVKLVEGLSRIFKLFLNDSFRTYIHPEKEIDRLVVMAGFEKVLELHNREWFTAVYRKG